MEIGFDSKGIYFDEPHTVYDADMKEADLENPVLWSAEKPYLYTVVVEKAGEYIPFKVGMREQAEAVKLDFDIPQSRFGAYLNVSMKDVNGREVAFEQHMLEDAKQPEQGKGYADIIENGEYAIITGKGFTYKFYIEDLNGELESRIKLSVWRAPTDNDRKVKAQWYEAKYNVPYNKVYEIEIGEDLITVKGALSSVSKINCFTYKAVYRFYKDGQIDVILISDFLVFCHCI